MGKNKRKYPDQSEEDKARKKLEKIQKRSATKTENPVANEIKALARWCKNHELLSLR